MKKISFFACAAVLASAVALTGCKSNNQDEPQEKAPSVTTDITISLPSNAVGGPRRMPGTSVQLQASQFQGIENIRLVPFAKKGAVEAGDARQGSNIELGEIAATSELATVSKAKRYADVKVPMNTASFLFYGESKAKDATGDDVLFKKGVLAANRDANTPYGFTFELSPILTNKTTVTENAKCTGLLAYLNSLLTQVDDATPTPKAWKDYAAGVDDATFVLLRDTFQTLTTLTSFGVQRMMNDLYETLNLLPDGTLKTNLMNAIKNDTYVDFTANPVPATDPKIVLKEAYQGFPYSLNVPEGAVALSYSAGAFVLADPQNYSAEFAVPALTDYVYPSSLWYYANTRIKTSPNSKETELTSASLDWAGVLAAYEQDDSYVSGTTRSIALKGVVNYGVARLDVKVKAASTLADNTVPTPVNVTTNAAGYPVTAVLVGNQKNVGFDFTPENYHGANTGEYIIYDKVTTGDIHTTAEFGEGNTNSTLVLATPAGANKDVYVAIELQNNSGVDFRGANGIIPADGKFYLVGKLLSDKANVQQTSETVNPEKRVFYPDYTTTARLTITNLKKAYNTIPDLRTPSLELGLSVDLTWENGKVYDIDL